MTGTDLIVLAPWIVFIAGLAVICVLLLRSRRASGSRPEGPPRSVRGAQEGPEPASHPDSQEATCRENNAEASPQ
jgi:hypothetical protein